MRLHYLLASAVCILALIAIVSGAKFNPDWKNTRVPDDFDHPTSFPSHEALKHEPRYQQGQIQLHVVPHTHDDVGWLKTVDQYYLGANNSIQHAAVRYILDTVVQELQKDPSRRFIYIEQAFFQTWFERQTSEIQSQVQALVASGQLEFLNGAWSMHDEAAAHYIDMVDQTTLGHSFIKQQFGITPKVGWQIDPFGHSATQAALLSGVVGFEGLFFGRIDHQDHDQRMMDKNMEFIWRPSPSLGEQGQVFTGVFQNGNYGPPTDFCFDWFCNDDPVISDPTFIDYNVPQRVQQFLDRINYQAAFTKGINLMVTMGSDFQYENAKEWFENLDRLIQAVNADGRINMFYSTPSQYIAAKNAENLTWTVKTDDFFPYSDGDHAYWTGYFTSRPALKRYIRMNSALLLATRQIEAMTGGNGNSTMLLAKAVGITQHHDAVSGTSKQHVAFDYAQRLHIAQTEAQEMMTNTMAALVTNGFPSSQPPQYSFCDLSNITICDVTVDQTEQQQGFQVLLYNSLARTRMEYVYVPVAQGGESTYQVYSPNNTLVTSQLLNVYNVSSHTPDSAQFQLMFQAEVPPLGYATYFVTVVGGEKNSKKHQKKSKKFKHSRTAASQQPRSRTYPIGSSTRQSPYEASPPVGLPPVSISNDLLTLTFSGDTGLAQTLTNKVTGVTEPFSLQFAYYNSYQSKDDQNSGAYIFRPMTQLPATPVLLDNPASSLIVQTGPLVQELTQVITTWINATYRLTIGSPYVEVEYTVGSIPIDDGVGKEVVMQYQSSLQTKGMWYTDSNGREMIPRYRNKRVSYNYTVTEPIAGNFVPVTTCAFMQDLNANTQLTVLTDRAVSVGSPFYDGVLEVMVHRRLLNDDGRGVGEPLNETSYISPYPEAVRQGPGLIITGKHYFMFDNISSATSQWRPLMQRIYNPLVALYSPLSPSQSVSSYIQSHNTEATYMIAGSDFPVNVDLISLQSWAQWAEQGENSNGTVLLIRLAHQFAVNEDPVLSEPVSIDLSTIFTQQIQTIQEVSLTAVSTLGELKQKKRHWQTEEPKDNNMDAPEPVPRFDTQITLNPMEIQTFIITI